MDVFRSETYPWLWWGYLPGNCDGRTLRVESVWTGLPAAYWLANYNLLLRGNPYYLLSHFLPLYNMNLSCTLLHPASPFLVSSPKTAIHTRHLLSTCLPLLMMSPIMMMMTTITVDRSLGIKWPL